MQKPVLLMIWKWDGWMLRDCSPCCIALSDQRSRKANHLLKNVPGEVGYGTCTFLWAIRLRRPQEFEVVGAEVGEPFFTACLLLFAPSPRQCAMFSLASQSSPLKQIKTLKTDKKKIKLLSNSLCICCVILCRTENSCYKKGLRECASANEVIV